MRLVFHIDKTDSITGTFKQGAVSVPMTLKRTPAEIKPVNRPQEPKPPYPYRSEDVTFENKSADVTLAGTLTMPETGNNFTTVILITGSGAQDRNEEIMGHKPFLVIAEYLTRRGIAVLRYYDHGFAHSTGNISTSTTADFSSDAELLPQNKLISEASGMPEDKIERGNKINIFCHESSYSASFASIRYD